MAAKRPQPARDHRLGTRRNPDRTAVNRQPSRRDRHATGKTGTTWCLRSSSSKALHALACLSGSKDLLQAALGLDRDHRALAAAVRCDEGDRDRRDETPVDDVVAYWLDAAVRMALDADRLVRADEDHMERRLDAAGLDELGNEGLEALLVVGRHRSIAPRDRLQVDDLAAALTRRDRLAQFADHFVGFRQLDAQ
jgi:hypothetical protein